MANKFIRIFLVSFVAAGLIVLVIVTAAAHAQSLPSGGAGYGVGAGAGRGQMPPGAFGTVTAINGTTITLSNPRNNTTYSVDASNAVVTKDGAASSLSNIAVGDMVMAQGTVNGTSVTATKIMDGFAGGAGGFRGGRFGSSTRPFNGSGTNGFYGGRPSGTPSGTSPFAGAGFSPPVAPTSTSPAQPRAGFLGSIINFFGGLFSHFRF